MLSKKSPRKQRCKDHGVGPARSKAHQSACPMRRAPHPARNASRAIPIVFVAIADPVAQDFVESLAHPGGMITGFGVEEPDMGAKWVELLREIASGVRSIAVIFNPGSSPFSPMGKRDSPSWLKRRRLSHHRQRQNPGAGGRETRQCSRLLHGEHDHADSPASRKNRL